MSIARARALPLLAAAALVAVSASLSACSAAAGEAQAPSTAAGPSTSSSPSAPSVGVLPTAPAPADPDLPSEWPADLPSYVGGQLSTVTISEDGAAINATWTDDLPRQEAFAAMQSALEARGLQPTSETGGQDMLITTEDMISNDYTGDAFDVNLTVVTAGDQATIMLNASRR